MTRLLLTIALLAAVTSCKSDADKLREKLHAERVAKEKANPPYWKITQDGNTWWCKDYGSIGGLILVDGRLVDLDGSFTAEQVYWKHLPEEWQDQTLARWKPYPLPEVASN